MKNQKKYQGYGFVVSYCIDCYIVVGCAPTGGNAPQPTVSAPKPTAAPAGMSQQSFEGITLRMWTFLDPTKTSGREVALKQIIENFKNEYNIDVVVEPQVWDVMTAKFFAAHNAGNAPDIQWVNMDDMGTAIKQKALEPFENLFMKDWTDEQLKNVQDSFWDYGSVDGLHYQMGFSRNYIGIIYREDLLKEAGYEAPFKNWDEFRQAAKDLTVENDPITGVKRYGFGSGLSLDKSDPWFVVNTILSEQGSLFAEDGKASFAIDPAVKAIQLFSDMMNVDKSIPEGVVTQALKMFTRFQLREICND